ncbi:Histidine kinase-, DNA gyrase B-, and HSP90-like ATPase [Chryseobacterium arachidis]|uniref:Histidine kinase-, DNA gyrase B-, and HSP90-like ATPase n=1 Tax=Chryseobacterium arachidis TaxID=1416778 RepID=A0A1M4TWN1_9FLAO|nr:ATP-binding protein [Chryseobacterium arachidis]SHE48868.1 Histidine kinase-, DNA gyrase B-, and HSP90-like ATPase [Chryseobacterium arachidis]
MKVKLGQAVKMFFGNSSLEMVYFEALSNAMDAGATLIDIKISIDAVNRPETLTVEIIDNGVGFDDNRYKKFSNLFDVEESSHKGLGRLVYLCYFDEIIVQSQFEKDKKRLFTFNQQFEEEKFSIISNSSEQIGTSLKMQSYTLQKIAKSEYIYPQFLKKRILQEFYSRLFKYKIENRIIEINIFATIDGKSYKEFLTSSEIPDMQCVNIDDSSLNLYENFQLYYSIEKCDPHETALISAISVDNRTFKVELVADENIPTGYKMIFLLFSDFFTGKVDAARQNLTLTKVELKEIQKLFRKKVTSLIEKHIPRVKVTNEKIKTSLIDRYPHLNGYFDTDNIGYIKRNEILRNAQEEFFKAQKELLDATQLTDEQFKKSLEISDRALTEYILFRQLTIEKLRNSTKDDSETYLHEIIASKGKNGKFLKENLINDIYKNNSWLLDDKYMTYEVTLSDREMSELVTYLVDEEVEKDIDRPDFAFIFSNNPNENKPFDVVIVEIKKRGVNQYDNLKTINQLETRARNLNKYYNNKVQRVWYYGIIEFNDEIELALSGRFTELYSSGKLYYTETEVAISLRPKMTIPIGIFMWDIDAVVRDADARNSTFLNFIKSKFSTQ